MLLQEALTLMNLRPGRIWIDATAGAGGHLKAMLEQAGADGTVIGIDRDRQAVASLARRFAGQATIVLGNYSNLGELLSRQGVGCVTGGILADLGVSSMQLDDGKRGFSFMRDGPLDMRMDRSQTLTAADIVNETDETELANIIYRWGEERASRRIAHAIARERPLTSTQQLADLVCRCVRRTPRDRSHPATRTFQALRIAVNNELHHLEQFLQQAVGYLAPKARLVVITFHSLEDRLVKQTFNQAARNCICPPGLPVCACNHRSQLAILTRKPVSADKKEVLANPRSRSAKLRAAEKKSL